MNYRINNMKCLLFIAFSFGFILHAQDKKTQRAKQDFNSYAYAEAIESYEKLVKEGYTSEEIYKNLGDAYYQKGNYNASAYWYEQLFNLSDITVDAEYLYKYAQTLKSSGDYTGSDAWMQKFTEQKKADIRALKFKQNKDYLQSIKKNSGRYDLKNIAINSTSADFAPSFFGERLIFSTARDTGRILKSVHKWNNKPFTNLYTAKVSENGEYMAAERLSKKLNKKTHESSTAFTKDGSTVYFTRNNSKNGNFLRDKEGLSRLKIYRATLIDGLWKDVMELPFNSENYSVAHPTLSKDEKKLYFASDMPGTYGQSDIFEVDINEDGTFGVPKNLGNEINTESRETFPFVTGDDVLYFASDGHPGLGGLDIFATKIDDLNAIYILNLGEPVNSVQDDFSFIIDEETKKGLFASSREGGVGSDDIYSFTETKPLDLICKTIITGVVKDKETGGALGNTEIKLFNSENRLVSSSSTNEMGVFTTEGNCAKGSYKIVASKNDYDEGESTFVIEKGGDVSDVEIMLNQVDKSAPLGTDLAKYLNIEPIYFDFDKYFIRDDARASIDKVLAYLNEYPKVNIQVRSHTDSRANEQYNQLLSENRAKATAEYLIEKGISSDRISYKGYGETTLANSCDNAVPCSKENHQLNRRSEFIVVE
ncbi:OmpA family protein [Maribacter litoralis]|uniref:Outer membrane protein OmpA n=1 Tax=Maribacter litoralis TaxID=2059726 RepID=A0A653UWG2_9FLAO|nr:OmpA family protein [Maribacter litoralis]VXB97400.1 Outer membrane protein OmpA [Maribacter litoralis]